MNDVASAPVIPVKSKVRPTIVVFGGRGRVGKTWAVRAMDDVLKGLGLPVQVWDADREKTVSLFVKDAKTIDRIDDEGRRVFIERCLTQMVVGVRSQKPHHVLLDMPGDDRVIMRLQGEAKILKHLQAAGVEIVAVHVVGPAEADLRYLKLAEGDAEKEGLFRPDRAVLLRNEGLISAMVQPDVSFQTIDNSAVVTRFLQRGTDAWMPALPPEMVSVLEDPIRGGQHTLRQWCDQIDVEEIGFVGGIRLREWLETEMLAVADAIFGGTLIGNA